MVYDIGEYIKPNNGLIKLEFGIGDRHLIGCGEDWIIMMDLDAKDIVIKHLDIDKKFNCEKIYDI